MAGHDSKKGASCGPRSSCSLNWRREFRSLVPILGQLARSADNAPLFNYHSDNKYWANTGIHYAPRRVGLRKTTLRVVFKQDPKAIPRVVLFK